MFKFQVPSWTWIGRDHNNVIDNVVVALSLVLSTRSLLGPNTSTIPLNRASQFPCEVFCHEWLLVTWLINGSFLDNTQLRSHVVSTRSDHAVRCSSNESAANMFTDTLEVLADFLDHFTVQCVAVSVCDQPGDGEVAGCRPSVCYSQLIHVEGTLWALIVTVL